MMEVIHHRAAEEEVAEPMLTWRPDDTQAPDDNNGLSEQSVYFDKNEGTTSLLDNNLGLEDVDIQKLVNAVINSGKGLNVNDDEIVTVPNNPISDGEKENVRMDLVEESDEEVIELEFERAVEKVHTHTAYCPNCSSRITKVVLRRRKKEKRHRSDEDTGRRDGPVDLFGCLSCFSIFMPSENGLNPFGIFGKKGKQESTKNVEEKHERGTDHPARAERSENADEKTSIEQARSAFDLFWIFRTGKMKEKDSQGKVDIHIDSSSTTLPVSSLHVPLLHGNKSSRPATKDEHYKSDSEVAPPDSSVPSGELSIDIRDGAGGGTTGEMREDPSAETTGVTGSTADERALVSNANYSKSLEILKCIVYGGLMESIASLSVVSSAAASDATTLNVIAIGVATVISGLFLFGHNLVDLKNDTVRRDSSQCTDKYQELLGTRGHFLLHSTFAVLSFILFGLIPPMTYGFTFRESDNKDYKILAVAAASFTCVLVLAIAKSYAQRLKKFGEYLKTVSYYFTMAITASGVSYAAGHLFNVLMQRLGWLEPAPAATLASASY